MSKGVSPARIVPLLLVLVVAGAGFAYFQFFMGTSPQKLIDIANDGKLLGESLEKATSAFGVEPQQLPKPPTENTTGELYLYVIEGDPTVRVLVRVQAGRITRTDHVDEKMEQIRPN